MVTSEKLQRERERVGDRDRRKGEAKERGRGPKEREPHMRTEERQHTAAMLTTARGRNRGQTGRPSSLTADATGEGRKTRAPGLSYTLK